jgi:hypothetical protein
MEYDVGAVKHFILKIERSFYKNRMQQGNTYVLLFYFLLT